MHPVSEMEKQWKWPKKTDKIWYKSIQKTIAPPIPLPCGRRTGAGSFTFEKDDDIKKIMILCNELVFALTRPSQVAYTATTMH